MVHCNCLFRLLLWGLIKAAITELSKHLWLYTVYWILTLVIQWINAASSTSLLLKSDSGNSLSPFYNILAFSIGAFLKEHIINFFHLWILLSYIICLEFLLFSLFAMRSTHDLELACGLVKMGNNFWLFLSPIWTSIWHFIIYWNDNFQLLFFVGSLSKYEQACFYAQ